MTAGERLWGGRFGAAPAQPMMAFTRSAGFDVALVDQDCRVLAAHAATLEAAGLLDPEAAAQAAGALPGIAADIASGAFPVAAGDEDVHTTVERALHERAPNAAARIRAGLSRNDRVATAFRLWVAETAGALGEALDALRATVEERATGGDDTVMPGYTHLQRAQPVTLGLHLRAHAAALDRAGARLRAAAGEALAACPLGAGALAGTTLPLDPKPAAAALGFAAPCSNSLDAVADRDFAAAFLFACAATGVACSRLGEDVVLWCSAEFGFARPDDAWASGSSLMPQKRNPDVAELARGKAGRLIGHLTALLTTLKGLPLAYNRDLQEDKEATLDAGETLRLMLPALEGLIRTLAFDAGRMRAAASDPALFATDLAEGLVARGVPFAEAHEAVGRAARRAEELGTDLAELPAEEWRSAHPGLPEAADGIFDPARSVSRRRTPHSP